jgi:hypothetical protein
LRPGPHSILSVTFNSTSRLVHYLFPRFPNPAYYQKIGPEKKSKNLYLSIHFMQWL